MKPAILILSTVLSLSLASPPARALESQSWFSGIEFYLGASRKSMALDVYDKDETDSDGSLTDGDVSAWFVGTSLPYVFLDGSQNLGYFWAADYSSFHLDRQWVDDGLTDQDFGTYAKGRYWMICPHVFYRIGDRWRPGGWGEVIFGLGVGVGHLQMEGAVVLTELPGDPLHEFDVKGYGLAVNLPVEYHYRNWMVRLRGGGPSVSDGPYDYDIFDFSMDFGYRFAF